MTKEATSRQISIDGSKYDVKDLSKAAKAALINLRITDDEIKRLRVQLGIAQTARRAYAAQVKANLPKTKQ